jgi:F-type H+-transporting ATPase subunit epsilon
MLKLKIVTLAGIKYDQEVYEVLLPTLEGQIGIFEGHADLVTTADEGIIRVREKSGDKDEYMTSWVCHGGVIEIEKGVIKVLVDEASHADEVVEAVEQKALEAAKQLRSDARDQVSLDEAQKLLDRSSVRLKLASLRRHKNR